MSLRMKRRRVKLRNPMSGRGRPARHPPRSVPNALTRRDGAAARSARAVLGALPVADVCARPTSAPGMLRGSTSAARDGSQICCTMPWPPNVWGRCSPASRASSTLSRAAALGVLLLLLAAASPTRARTDAEHACTCSAGGMDAVGAETGPGETAQCARSASRRAIAARPPNAARAAACARAGRALDPADGWWDFVEGNALEFVGQRNKAASLYILALQRPGGDTWRARFSLANMLATSGYHATQLPRAI